MIKESPPLELRRGILASCFDKYNGTYASGVAANNKLDLEALGYYLELEALAVNGLTELVRPYKPDLIVPVPDGANRLGRQIAMALGIDAMILRKDSVTKEITMKPGAEQIFAAAKRIVVVEDVLNQRTTTSRVLALPWIGERTQAVVGVWDRGDPAARPTLAVPVQSLVEEFIPAELPQDSEYWSYIS